MWLERMEALRVPAVYKQRLVSSVSTAASDAEFNRDAEDQVLCVKERAWRMWRELLLFLC